MSEFTLHCGDCLDVLPALDECSVDSVVTDPPYGLSFMGKDWDHGVPGVQFWREVLRVAKPGAHLLAFGGTRTYHRLTCAIEDAGWEIRDCLMWVYGSGFPKSLDVSKAIDKAAGAEREVVCRSPRHGGGVVGNGSSYELPPEPHMLTAPATHEAHQWSGWGTALKPAYESIILARKPLIGTVAQNVLTHGTGALNIDGCRVETEDDLNGGAYSNGAKDASNASSYATGTNAGIFHQPSGRWPANFIHDGSEEVVGLKDAARFFYCPKASKADRDEGCEGIVERTAGQCTDRTDGSAGLNSPRAGAGRLNGSRNHHPTVKPTELMRYLCRLVTRPGGVVLDPFMGSGSTGKAAIREGFRFIGIELDPEFVEIARRRIGSNNQASMSLF